MCGIAGCLLTRPSQGALGDLYTLLGGIRQRGPDDAGAALVLRSTGDARHFATDETVASRRAQLPHLSNASAVPFDLALLNTRFAIIDLTANAHQPFASADGSIVATWNGEIYNYVELRSELERAGVAFRSASDTEVLVEGYRRWGDDLWPRLNGFWAVALHDARSQSLVISRDRFGVAPLYYRETEQGLYFASLARPLLAVERPCPEIDVETVRGFLATGLKDFDHATSYRAVRSFAPGTVLRFLPGATDVAGARGHQYWEYPNRRLTTRDLSLDDAARQVRETLIDSVMLRRRSDRAVAFELSGGLDSSSIVACAAASSTDAIPTYTIKVPARDEEPFANTLRTRYRLDYHVLRDLEATFVDEAADFARRVGAPYHSPNVFTCFAMRRVMQQHGVAVVVSGSGGDEVLAGYEFEFWPAAGRELWEEGRRWHTLCHTAVMHFGSRQRLLSTTAELIGWAKRLGRPERARWSSDPRTTGRAGALRRNYMSLPFQQQVLFHWRVGNLPYYLRSNDHVTMSLPLEHRFPFLDYRLVDLGLRLPVEYLFRNGWTKYVLRRAMESLLPASVVWRREKFGFPFPLKSFLQSHRDEFRPLGDAVADAGIITERPSYDELVTREPDFLWRICSTGLWLAA